jgi:GT2 family glycosyltransferase
MFAHTNAPDYISMNSHPHHKQENYDHSDAQPAYPRVSAVILNWNGAAYLEKFLPFLLASTYPNLEVVVADNASTDHSLALLAEKFSGVRVLRNSVNEGFAGGYNTALGQVEADYFVLLNSDVEVSPGWLEPIIGLMEGNTAIAACQPKILSYSDRSSFEYAGASGGWLDALGYPFSRGRIFDVLEKDDGQYNDAVPCFWASGACLVIRSDVYRNAGGLDAYFFAHQEEIDLCWRLQRMGYRVYVQPASVVYHIGGGTLPRENNLKVFLNFRNNLIMLAKNLPFLSACGILPVRMSLDALAAWKGLLSGSGGYFVAIARAHLHFVKWLLFGPRKRGGLSVRNRAIGGLYRGSLVWKHFVRGLSRFSEIVPRD